MKWIKINKKIPEPGQFILIYGKNEFDKQRILRAVYIPKFFMEDEDNFLGELDYNEEKDMFFWPEGWYEWNEYDDTHWIICFEVTHWMPLPEYPKN